MGGIVVSSFWPRVLQYFGVALYGIWPKRNLAVFSVVRNAQDRVSGGAKIDANNLTQKARPPSDGRRSSIASPAW